MSAHPTPSRAARTLDRFGAASRCLLRLWENEGHLSPSEPNYLRQFEDQFPHWETRPGELDFDSLAVVAKTLGFDRGFSISHDYEEVQRTHRAGDAVILSAHDAGAPDAGGAVPQTQFMVLEQIDEEGFRAWCPFESGASDLLPRADRRSWDRRHFTAFVLHRAAATHRTKPA